MARKLREDFDGAVHHVFARGNNRQLIFRDDGDRVAYLRMLEQVVGRHGWRCLAYCLMHNHVHLLLETMAGTLGRGMQRLHGDYARLVNARHDRSGHLFQGRYGGVRVKTEAQLWTTVAYIVRNPVEAGLATSPEAWTWSSHRATLEGTAPAWLDVRRLLDYFGAAGGVPLKRYASFISAAPSSSARRG